MARQGSVVVSGDGHLVALLCVSDSGQDVPAALKPVYGQPFLHHLVKALEGLGIQRFFVAIDSVPGALLTYCDWAKGQGLDIVCLRNPAELAAQIDDDVRVVALTADTVWHPDILQEAIEQGRTLIATVEEQSANQHYERIDLNNRWAGLAMLGGRNLAQLTELPEGWDVGSALLRQAQQDGIEHWLIAQKHLQAGKLQRLLPEDDITKKLRQVAEFNGATPKSFETYLFAPLCRRLQPFIWSTSWSRATVEWLFPGLAALSAALAISDFALSAAFTSFFAIFAATLRSAARLLEYKSGRTDWIGFAGFGLLTVGLGALLFHATRIPGEALFLTLAIILLSLFASGYWKKCSFWLLSPLLISLSVVVGVSTGVLGGALKLAILAELASLLLSQLTPKRDEQIPIDRA